MEVKGDFIINGNYVDVHDNENVYLTVGEDVKVKKQSAHFPPCRNYAQGEAILAHLKEKGFVERNTEPINFLRQMGCTDERPDKEQPIVWLKTKQLLREMLERWFDRLLQEQSLKKAKLEAICSQVFIDKQGNMIHLPKNKPYPSSESDDLKDFFATL